MADKNMPLIISHFTKSTPYDREAKKLAKSLKMFDLDYHIEGIKNQGSWRANSNWCAWQIQKMLIRYPKRDILRIDCDAIIQRHPSLFLSEDFKADVAAVIWQKSLMRPSGEFLGGTMFFANTDNTRFIVDQWVEQCTITPDRRNGDMLWDVIKNNKNKVLFTKLPLSYCAIFDLMKSEVPEPVIEHFQASRRFKAMINNG